MKLRAIATPIDTPTPTPPATPTATETPITLASIALSRSAVMVAAPPLASVRSLDCAKACVSVRMVLVAAAPARLSARPAPTPKPAPMEAANASASIDDASVAAIWMPWPAALAPLVVTTASVIDASTVLAIVLLPMATPIDTPTPTAVP